MKDPKVLLALLCCLIFGGASSASAAANAGFAGYCTLDYGTPNATAYCSFSALWDTVEADPSSCSGSWISKIEWDLGDGNYFEDDSFVMTSYPDAVNLGAVYVRVKVTCGDSTSDEAARVVGFVNLGCAGCITMNNGWD